MEPYQDLAIYVAGGLILLIILVTRRFWRGVNKDRTITPVSEQWLAERRGKRPPE